ncbi:GntR family transcriptional regulator [Qingshengfaniella alkalisoli]|uniref:GntR family transcriptional regulator n=1 Tax=Qingshengfaniella alkalisoli TaxID=2599296 RepID=A0A5B8JBN8_9RHOB|nr:GntR family transcriptional regulator [Qingshengfaniella alkalisoli]QDY71520.1 GntR family transcriptional regulator [Qingshengfaniella alkalisoli]
MPQNKGEVTSRPRKRRAPNTAPTGPAQFLTRGGSTYSEIIYRKLRHAIVSMEMTPGTPILEREIASEEGVSRTPIRDAVLRLAEEQLVEIVPKSGTFVGRIPMSALPEALIARRALEDVTVRRATELAAQNQLEDLDALIVQQAKAIAREDENAFHEADELFHIRIAEISRLPGIWRLIASVKVQVDRYRRLTLPVSGRMATAMEEHDAVLRAMRAKDIDRAASAMSKHLSGLQIDFPKVRDMFSDHFIHDLDLSEDWLDAVALQPGEKADE